MSFQGILIIAGAVVFLFLSVVIVKEKTAVVIQRLGKFSRIQQAGLNFKIPFIEGKAGAVNLKVQQLDVSIETKTKDNVFVNMRVSVQYKIKQTAVRDAFYKLDDAESQISAYVFDDVRAEVPKMDLDDVFAKKEDIAVAVKQNLSESMEEYGFTIVKALIADIDPDAHVKESMNRINAAKRDKEAALEEAEAKKINIVKEAEAEAESKRLQGEGTAQQRLEIVRGFKESVEDFQNSLESVSHEEVMRFVLLTQYFDTLNNIGSNGKNTTVMIPNSPGAMADFQSQLMNGVFLGNEMGKDNSENS